MTDKQLKLMRDVYIFSNALPPFLVDRIAAEIHSELSRRLDDKIGFHEVAGDFVFRNGKWVDNGGFIIQTEEPEGVTQQIGKGYTLIEAYENALATVAEAGR